MVATKPFLASQARFGLSKSPLHQRNFFTFCATVASLAARETLSLMRYMEVTQQIKGLTAFDRHFLVQSATVLALSSVVQFGQRDERLRFRECIEMLLRIPGARHGYLIREMRAVESKLEQFEMMKGSRSPYVQLFTAYCRDSTNIFDTPGVPSLAVKTLIQQFVGPRNGIDGSGAPEDEEENLARWIPKRVIWEDVPECISFGLRREGFID
jgi:hypothetical protein